MKAKESYLIFARKFRPQTFDEVVGQEPITTTLKNAILKNRIAQSFLFTGPRGIGKTSTARIFAKALNCEKGPSANPCNQCSVCQEITQGNSLDVLEIDGASNRGVDEIRSLRDNVKFKPAHARFKIYIIDEVHMLTGEAFNALLKTLEEPPAHVKFIFATTEVHKVPLTILSRCQRFNFRRIPIADLSAKLKDIAKKEKIKIDDPSVFLIAKSAEGSLRDAESLLDQLASFGEGEIKEEDIIFSLGLTGEDSFFTVIQGIKNKDSKKVLSAVQSISEEGKDLSQFSKGLLELFRNLLVLKSGEHAEELVEVTEDSLKQLKALKEQFSKEELLFALTLVQQLTRDIRWSDAPRFLIETTLLKLVYRADLRAIDEILNEIKALSKKPRPVYPQSSEPVVKISAEPLKKKINQSFSFDDVCRVWPDLVDRIKSAKMSCGTYLSEAVPVEVVDGFAVFGFPVHLKFHKEALEQQAHKELIRSTLSALVGHEINVSFVIQDGAEEKRPPVQKPATSSADIINSALHMFTGSKIIHRDNP